MMRKTHRAFSSTFWLGSTLAVNGIGYETGHMWVNPIVAGLGFLVVQPFSAGKLSPDIDHQWAPGPPRRNYDWRYHRGFTHRVWFAAFLTALWAVPLVWVLRHTGSVYTSSVVALWAAPAGGWWSHLAGDMIYGRLRILGRPVGLGWETGGLSETGRSRKGGTKLWVTDPASKVFLVTSAALATAHLAFALRFLAGL